MIKRSILSLCAGMVLATVSPAAMITFSDSVAQQTTNFTDSVSIPKFDTSLGTLTKVTWTLFGEVDTSFEVESLDASASVVTQTAKGTITLTDPMMNVLVVVLPEANSIFNATAYDGVIDFGGTSGKTTPSVVGSAKKSMSTMNAASLALFTGMGNIILPVSAIGASTASGPGNLISSISTKALAEVEVTYEYTPGFVIPEPSSMVLMGSALALVVGLVRRKRS